MNGAVIRATVEKDVATYNMDCFNAVRLASDDSGSFLATIAVEHPDDHDAYFLIYHFLDCYRNCRQ